jgi:hypothetical protein
MRAALALFFLACLSLPAAAKADKPLLVRFTPTPRAQIAMWVEDEAGNFMGTVRLTDAVALRGIGNRPGALQMNSGFRWPYGRREGVLPIWAHRRAAAPGAELFPFVIFQNRYVNTLSTEPAEGHASRTVSDSSRDDYFCLSFNKAYANQDALDAVSCASVFNSDKGRYMTEADIAAGYFEPFDATPGVDGTRALPLFSFYPPRRDVTGLLTYDHADASRFLQDANAVMPELDAISMATLQGDVARTLQVMLPGSWPEGSYFLFVEVNTEGDHNETYSAEAYPKPDPDHTSMYWDSYARGYGYPYRGQPSVVYRLAFELDAFGGTYSVDEPIGYSDVQGLDGELRPMDATITDDPAGHPGSGADRLRSVDGQARLVGILVAKGLCTLPEPPAECGMACVADEDCPTGFLCGSENTCLGVCDETMPPPPVTELSAATYPDQKNSHHWARLTFVPSRAERRIIDYRLKVSQSPIETEADFMAARNANAADIDTVGAIVCHTDESGLLTCPPPGAPFTLDIGQLAFDSEYHVALRPIDECGEVGPFVTAAVHTTPIHFTTVSPCFVATATYGSPMAAEVETLRRFRDRYLMTHTPGRAFVAVYYAVGPYFADAIRDSPRLRAASRVLLEPLVALAHLLVDDTP